MITSAWRFPSRSVSLSCPAILSRRASRSVVSLSSNNRRGEISSGSTKPAAPSRRASAFSSTTLPPASEGNPAATTRSPRRSPADPSIRRRMACPCRCSTTCPSGQHSVTTPPATSRWAVKSSTCNASSSASGRPSIRSQSSGASSNTSIPCGSETVTNVLNGWKFGLRQELQTPLTLTFTSGRSLALTVSSKCETHTRNRLLSGPKSNTSLVGGTPSSIFAERITPWNST